MAGQAKLPDGVRRLNYPSLGSTNAEALRLARQGELAQQGEGGPLWITAAEQVAGRGRRGRVWVSGKGNLHASLRLIDPAPPDRAATIAFVAGIALHGALAELLSPRASASLALKWPNDLILSGGKIAGILVEGERLNDGRFAVIVGFGVNCRFHPEMEGHYPAADLFSQGEVVEAQALFERLAKTMQAEMTLWSRGEGFSKIRQRWLDRALGLGGEIVVNLGERAIEGRFDALDEAGCLIVRRPNGHIESVAAGDVFFAREPA